MNEFHGQITVLKQNVAIGKPIKWCTESLIIGSDESCDGCIYSDLIDKKHCAIRLQDIDDKAYLIHIGKSSFKTMLEGVEITKPSALNHNSVFTVGKISFLFEYHPTSKWFYNKKKSSPMKCKISSENDKSMQIYNSTPKHNTYSIHCHRTNSPKVSPIAYTKTKIMTITPVKRLNVRPFLSPLQNKLVRKSNRKSKSHLQSMNIGDKRRHVSFGPNLSPEQFDKELPPIQPLKKGATPMKINSIPSDSTAIEIHSINQMVTRRSSRKHFSIASLSSNSSDNNERNLFDKSDISSFALSNVDIDAADDVDDADAADSDSFIYASLKQSRKSSCNESPIKYYQQGNKRRRLSRNSKDLYEYSPENESSIKIDSSNGHLKSISYRTRASLKDENLLKSSRNSNVVDKSMRSVRNDGSNVDESVEWNNIRQLDNLQNDKMSKIITIQKSFKVVHVDNDSNKSPIVTRTSNRSSFNNIEFHQSLTNKHDNGNDEQSQLFESVDSTDQSVYSDKNNTKSILSDRKSDYFDEMQNLFEDVENDIQANLSLENTKDKQETDISNQHNQQYQQQPDVSMIKTPIISKSFVEHEQLTMKRSKSQPNIKRRTSIFIKTDSPIKGYSCNNINNETFSFDAKQNGNILENISMDTVEQQSNQIIDNHYQPIAITDDAHSNIDQSCQSFVIDESIKSMENSNIDLLNPKSLRNIDNYEHQQSMKSIRISSKLDITKQSIGDIQSEDDELVRNKDDSIDLCKSFNVNDNDKSLVTCDVLDENISNGNIGDEDINVDNMNESLSINTLKQIRNDSIIINDNQEELNFNKTDSLSMIESSNINDNRQLIEPIPTSETTIPIPTSESTIPIPTSESTIPMPTSESTIPIPTSESTIPIPTSESTIPTFTDESIRSISPEESMIPISTEVSIIPTLHKKTSVNSSVRTRKSSKLNDSLMISTTKSDDNIDIDKEALSDIYTNDISQTIHKTNQSNRKRKLSTFSYTDRNDIFDESNINISGSNNESIDIIKDTSVSTRKSSHLTNSRRSIRKSSINESNINISGSNNESIDIIKNTSVSTRKSSHLTNSRRSIRKSSINESNISSNMEEIQRNIIENISIRTRKSSQSNHNKSLISDIINENNELIDSPNTSENSENHNKFINPSKLSTICQQIRESVNNNDLSQQNQSIIDSSIIHDNNHCQQIHGNINQSEQIIPDMIMESNDINESLSNDNGNMNVECYIDNDNNKSLNISTQSSISLDIVTNISYHYSNQCVSLKHNDDDDGNDEDIQSEICDNMIEPLIIDKSIIIIDDDDNDDDDDKGSSNVSMECVKDITESVSNISSIRDNICLSEDIESCGHENMSIYSRNPSLKFNETDGNDLSQSKPHDISHINDMDRNNVMDSLNENENNKSLLNETSDCLIEDKELNSNKESSFIMKESDQSDYSMNDIYDESNIHETEQQQFHENKPSISTIDSIIEDNNNHCLSNHMETGSLGNISPHQSSSSSSSSSLILDHNKQCDIEMIMDERMNDNEFINIDNHSLTIGKSSKLNNTRSSLQANKSIVIDDIVYPNTNVININSSLSMNISTGLMESIIEQNGEKDTLHTPQLNQHETSSISLSTRSFIINDNNQQISSNESDISMINNIQNRKSIISPLAEINNDIHLNVNDESVTDNLDQLQHRQSMNNSTSNKSFIENNIAVLSDDVDSNNSNNDSAIDKPSKLDNSIKSLSASIIIEDDGNKPIRSLGRSKSYAIHENKNIKTPLSQNVSSKRRMSSILHKTGGLTVIQNDKESEIIGRDSISLRENRKSMKGKSDFIENISEEKKFDSTSKSINQRKSIRKSIGFNDDVNHGNDKLMNKSNIITKDLEHDMINDLNDDLINTKTQSASLISGNETKKLTRKPNTRHVKRNIDDIHHLVLEEEEPKAKRVLRSKKCEQSNIDIKDIDSRLRKKDVNQVEDVKDLEIDSDVKVVDVKIKNPKKQPKRKAKEKASTLSLEDNNGVNLEIDDKISITTEESIPSRTRNKKVPRVVGTNAPTRTQRRKNKNNDVSISTSDNKLNSEALSMTNEDDLNKTAPRITRRNARKDPLEMIETIVLKDEVVKKKNTKNKKVKDNTSLEIPKTTSDDIDLPIVAEARVTRGKSKNTQNSNNLDLETFKEPLQAPSKRGRKPKIVDQANDNLSKISTKSLSSNGEALVDSDSLKEPVQVPSKRGRKLNVVLSEISLKSKEVNVEPLKESPEKGRTRRKREFPLKSVLGEVENLIPVPDVEIDKNDVKENKEPKAKKNITKKISSKRPKHQDLEDNELDAIKPTKTSKKNVLSERLNLENNELDNLTEKSSSIRTRSQRRKL